MDNNDNKSYVDKDEADAKDKAGAEAKEDEKSEEAGSNDGFIDQEEAKFYK